MTMPFRPSMKILSEAFVQKIINEAFQLLERVGVFVENREAERLLLDAGAMKDSATSRLRIPARIIQDALASAPHTITMVDASGEQSYCVGGDEIHFDPGSAALRIFDHQTQSERKASTHDLIRFSRLIQQLEHFHFQSTGLISSDVPEQISDCYRLYLALQHCSKPIVTGLFVVEGFEPMRDMLSAVRGGADQLREKPLAIFDACPSPPLKWSNLTSQSVLDCARSGIPSEIVSMPLTGATAPITLAGALVQLAAENLAGVAMAQLADKSAPVIFGGSPAAFDLRTANAPMGAMETMMIDSAYSQIGKALGLPTHAYLGLSDSKCVDAQAGLETGMGMVMAALSGINVISGGGMIDYEMTQSLEKLVIDNEICGMAYRLIEGIAQRDEPIALDLFPAGEKEFDFLTNPHTLEWFHVEQKYPRIIDRGTHEEWERDGKPTLAERASQQVQKLLEKDSGPILNNEVRTRVSHVMKSHANRFGLEELPQETVS
ncbi:MAG: trimethylamine methyltransferase family protein [bacterium]